MSPPRPSAAGEEAEAGSAELSSANAHVGDLIDACAIDLPPNDVVESIEFERFFVLNARLADSQRPVTMVSAWASMRSEELSSDEVKELGPDLLIGAPLSNKRRDWDDLAAFEAERRP